jgi:L-lactate utilization protein LutC
MIEQKWLGVSGEAETAPSVEPQQKEAVGKHDRSSLTATELEQIEMAARERETKAKKQVKEEAERTKGAEQELVGVKDQFSALKEPGEAGVCQGEDQPLTTIVAPPGSLGLIIFNMTESRGTVVKRVNAFNVLAEKISPGDSIIAIDGEGVSLMNACEIGTIMAIKSGLERKLTVPSNGISIGWRGECCRI